MALLLSSSLALAQTDEGPALPGGDAPLAEEEGKERLVEVRVEGNRRVEAEAVRRALVNKPGRLFDPGKTAEDLRALWALKYFSDIELLVQRLPAGGVVYVVRVSERPAVREVRLSGNEELSKEDLKDEIDIRPYSILDLEVVRRNARKIQEKYVEKGYFLAEVTHRLEPVPDTADVDVVFVVNEHAKVMVKEVRFLGAQKVDPAELKAVMATREGSYLSFLTNEGTFREELFQRDLAMVQGAYYDRGFINVKVDKPVVSITPDKRYIYITIKVEEGEQYSIGKLDFSGDLIVAKQRLGAMMSSKEGELFNRTKLSKDIMAITDIAYDEGYAYANITPVTNVKAEERTIDLTFDIQKGSKVTVERIEVVGNTKTRDTVIRRELRVYEGELFSGTGLRRSKERVTALGFFESVEVTHKPGKDTEHVVVIVEIKEKATGTFQVGLGFSNVEDFIFTAQVSQNNFAGWGWSVAASAQLSRLRNYIQFSFFDPHFFDTDYIFSLDFFRVQSDFFGFLRNSLGGNVNLGYQLGAVAPWLEDVMANVTYTQEHVDVEPGRDFKDISLSNQFRDGVTSSVRGSITWDRRDNRLFPSKGFMNYGSVEYAPPWLGGSYLFTRYTAYSRLYFPLPWGLVFKTNATFGLVQQLDENSPLPVSENYYLGGINTIRGYALRTVGPYVWIGDSLRPDSFLEKFVVGGNKQAIFNLELEIPIFDQIGIRGVVFYDAGNAYAPGSPLFRDPQHDLPLGLFHSVGVGFRWFSPIGPLRFEWGVPLTPRPQDEPVLFEFNIGNFF